LFPFETEIIKLPESGCLAVPLNENSSFYANAVSGFFEPAVYGPLLKTAICSA